MNNQPLTEEEIELGPLPQWAVAHITDGSYLHVRAALPTRDGRRCGNAVVTVIYPMPVHHLDPVVEVITDAGHRMVLTKNELEELFYPPRWIMSEFLPAHQATMDRISSPKP